MSDKFRVYSFKFFPRYALKASLRAERLVSGFYFHISLCDVQVPLCGVQEALGHSKFKEVLK